MPGHKPLSTDAVRALLGLAGLAVSLERAEQLATDSDALFAEADEVSAFMAPRREIGLAVHFSPLVVREEGQ